MDAFVGFFKILWSCKRLHIFFVSFSSSIFFMSGGAFPAEGYGGFAESNFGGASHTGIVVGIAEAWDLVGETIGVVLACEYIEKGGVTNVSLGDPANISPLYQGEGQLALGYIQPTLSFRARASNWELNPVFYFGGGLGILVRQDLSAPGAPDEVWNYLDQINSNELVGVVGVSLYCHQAKIDFRMTKGATSVFKRPQMAGERIVFSDFEAKNSSVQATLGFVF